MANEKDKQKQATSQKGTTYTQVNDSTYNWDAPTGYGVIHLDPNSGGPWGTYHVYQGSAGPDVEKRLSSDGLAPHLQNISTLKFKYPDPWWLPIKEYVAPRWNKLMDKAKIQKNGGWLQAYKNGGKTQEQEQMQQLLALVDAAYGELQQEKPGRSLQYLLQLMQDPQGAQMLEVLKAQVPEVQDVLDHIEQASLTSAFKKGGCVKSKVSKKVKKGAKGCVPCKRLMRVGGKLVNVWSDCEGNIISKHQVGGRFIPKGQDGLTAEQQAMLNSSHNAEWAARQAASISTKTKKDGIHYYIGTDGKVYSTTAGKNMNGYFWQEGQALSDAELQAANIVKDGNGYKKGDAALTDLQGLGNAYNEEVTAADPIQYTDGTNWYTANSVKGADGQYHWGEGVAANINDFGDDDMRTGLTKADLDAGTITRDQATTAGIDVSQFAGPSRTVRGVRVEGSNSLLGTTGEFTADDYLNRLGAKGVYQNERNLWRKKMREVRSDRASAYRNAAVTRRDDDTSNDKTRGSITATFKDVKNTYKKNFANQAAHNIDAIFNKYKNIPTGSYQPQGSDNGSLDVVVSGQQSAPHNNDKLDVVSAKKQGGWITKFN